MYVICNKANDPKCSGCGHSIPHKSDFIDDFNYRCTSWGDCYNNDKLFRVRCINTKSTTGKKILKNINDKASKERKRNSFFEDIEIGKIIRSKLTGESYLITGNYGDRATAVRTIDITNPDEWEIVQ